MEIAQQPDSASKISGGEIGGGNTGIDEIANFQLVSAIETIARIPLELLDRLLEGIDKVALVDYPEYANVGDSLIWLGQVILFKRLRKKIVYVDAAWHTDDKALRSVVEKGAAVIINGGGNFGTLWPEHQRFRESLLQKFPAATIIQMPQSICFAGEEALNKFQRIAAACPNFHLLVRDYPSFDLAKERFSGSVDLCPDCAFLLGPINAARADMDVLYLHRSDKEGVASHSMSQLAARSNLTVAETDWLQQNVVERLLQKFIRGLLRLRILRTTSALTLQLYNALARVRARRGIRIIARGHCVITDRLHAHILSVLMGRHNLLLDSSNGKVFAFHEAWTRGWPRTHKVITIEEAFTRAHVLSQRNALTRVIGALSLLHASLQPVVEELMRDCGECGPVLSALSNGWLAQ